MKNLYKEDLAKLQQDIESRLYRIHDLVRNDYKESALSEVRALRNLVTIELNSRLMPDAFADQKFFDSADRGDLVCASCGADYKEIALAAWCTPNSAREFQEWVGDATDDAEPNPITYCSPCNRAGVELITKDEYEARKQSENFDDDIDGWSRVIANSNRR